MSTKKTLENIVSGETILLKVRKAFKIAGDPKSGFKPSIELAEFVENSMRPATAVGDMNADDDRFIKAKPRHAFQPVSLKVAIDAGWITEEAFNKLTPAKGVDIENQEEGKHFITVNQLNPTFGGKRLRVQILETTETNRKGAQVKINPSNDKPVLSGGKPVYAIVQVAYEGNHESRFLASDGTKALLGTENAPAVAAENLNA